ncbi:hypothetical protein BN2497_13705 [Janthinobacterium sp. CG23_2]|nr:hypothetical protein BN2497_13705 [Janthinobacterium sp. CG23_2]CUU33250.1 hypothetical protein BN3177_13705 [Janthinobacterium sp. CG23_2]
MGWALTLFPLHFPRLVIILLVDSANDSYFSSLKKNDRVDDKFR